MFSTLGNINRGTKYSAQYKGPLIRLHPIFLISPRIHPHRHPCPRGPPNTFFTFLPPWLFKLLCPPGKSSPTAACACLTQPQGRAQSHSLLKAQPNPSALNSFSLLKWTQSTWSLPKGATHSLPCSVIIWITAFATVLNHKQHEARTLFRFLRGTYHNVWNTRTQ